MIRKETVEKTTAARKWPWGTIFGFAVITFYLALTIFFSLIPVLLAIGLAFWPLKGFPRVIGIFGLAACIIDIFFLATLLSGYTGAGFGSFMEWFSVFSYLVWIALISLDVLRRSLAVNQV